MSNAVQFESLWNGFGHARGTHLLQVQAEGSTRIRRIMLSSLPYLLHAHLCAFGQHQEVLVSLIKYPPHGKQRLYSTGSVNYGCFDLTVGQLDTLELVF